MTSFLGVLPRGELPFAKLLERSRFLPSAVLHFSLEGEGALCTGDSLTEMSISAGPYPPALRYAVSTRAGNTAARELAFLYQKHGRRVRKYLPEGVAFALWDARRRLLFLGSTEGARCYASLEADGLWFSTERETLLRAVRLDVGIFPFFKSGTV